MNYPEADAVATAIIEKIAPRLTYLVDQASRISAAPSMPLKAKVIKILEVGTKVADLIEPHTPCGTKCSHCCYQAVAMTTYEAAIIGEKIERNPAMMGYDAFHYAYKIGPESQTRYMGQACPFLKEGQCSIYDVRPLICRTHHSIEASPDFCKQGNTNPVSKLNLMELDTVMLTLPLRGIADIRDYFPSKD